MINLYEKLIKNKSPTRVLKHLKLMTEFLVRYDAKIAAMDCDELEQYFNHYLNKNKIENVSVSSAEWKKLLDDSVVDSYLNKVILQKQRVTIRKLLNNLDTTKLKADELRALTLLNNLVENNNQANNGNRYVVINSGFRFDFLQDENIVEDTEKEE